MRIIFFAGKGGTGKTSVTAATGIMSAEMGYRTIIVSLDIAHSLFDIFDLKKDLLDQSKGYPVEVGSNLWIQELDIQEEIQNNWGEIHRYLSGLLSTTGLDEVLAEELAILPGMEEVSLLMYINKYVREKQFDVILLDCAPTGESLRFISIPTTLEWYMQKIFRMERSIVKWVRPMAKRMYEVPLPDDRYFRAIEVLFERLKGVDRILTDTAVTTVRLVTNPEKIVLKETQRAFMYFSLYKMSIDAVIMNRILPDVVKDSYFEDWMTGQKRYIEEAKNIFSPVPILSAKLQQGEILGYDDLRDFAAQIYGAKNPLERFFKGEPFSFTKKNGVYRLRLRLPFILRDDVKLNKLGDELIIRVGAFKQHILLPRQLASITGIKAKLKDRYLDIFFGGDDHGGEKE